MTEMWRLSFIIPTYNDNQALLETLENIVNASQYIFLKEYEIIIVDDGSEIPVNSLDFPNVPNVRVIRQANKGRLAARLAGLENAKYKNVIFIDSRVTIKKESLQDLAVSIRNSPAVPVMVVGNIQFPENSKPIEFFWDAITRIVWSSFHESSTDLQLRIDNFDSLPKGTTLLYVEKDIMKDAYSTLSTQQIFSKDTNDDTLLIRRIVADNFVLCSKDFSAIYHPRSNIKKFLVHAYHRGKVADGGYFAPGTKGKKVAIASLTMLPVLFLIFQYSVITAYLIFGISFLLLEIFFFVKTSIKHLISLNLYVLPFLLFYIIGFIEKWTSKNLRRYR